MPTMRLDKFGGLLPKLQPRQLPPGMAQTAENCDLRRGRLIPVREPLTVEALPDALRKSIYYWSAAEKFLSWTTEVDVVRSPIAEDAFNRIYYTGDGAPKVRGLEDGVDKTYTLGVPKPANTPVVTVRSRSESAYDRSWGYFYEEPGGAQVDRGTLTEGTEIAETSANREFSLNSVPAKVSASADAQLVIFVEGTSTRGKFLGRIYSSNSIRATQSDFELNGATAVMDYNATASTLTITYDTARSTDYVSDRAYVYTFVTGWGEEGAPSSPSGVVAVDPTQEAVVSNLSTSVTGGTYNITKTRLYRTVTTSSGTEYQFVAEFTPTGSYTDDLDIDELGEILPSQDWDAPVSDLKGIVSHPNGFLAGFSGKTIYFSETFRPHAWPTEFAIGVDYDIVGLGVSGNGIVILTNGYPYIAVGVTPDGVTLTRIEMNQACVTKRSIVDNGNVVLYASPDGLVAIAGASASLLTMNHYTQDQWAELDPDTMISEIHDRVYYGFTDTASFSFDVNEGVAAHVRYDQAVSGLRSAIETDTMYMIQGSNITAWNDGEDNLQANWLSGEYSGIKPWCPVAARIVATSYPVTLVLNANGSEVLTRTVTGDEAFKLPILRREKYWAFGVRGTSEVDEVVISDSIMALKEVPA